jgi:hypothetical protein
MVLVVLRMQIALCLYHVLSTQLVPHSTDAVTGLALRYLGIQSVLRLLLHAIFPHLFNVNLEIVFRMRLIATITRTPF